MSSTTHLATSAFPSSAAEVPPARRILSIDIFRGLTMTVMIFVNELAGVHGLPWWTAHAHAQENRMTYVDMVFPAFLFILGMTIPIALENRLRKGSTLSQLAVHICVRSIALLVLGLILANGELGSRALMGIDPNVWTILALTGAILYWNVYPASKRHSTLFRTMRFSGLAMMILLLMIFRRPTSSGQSAWLDFSYPEILGLLGLTYFSVSILYLAIRRWSWAPLASFIALMVFCIASTAKWIPFPGQISMYVWPLGNGAMASIAMAGVVTSTIFVGERGTRWPALQQKNAAAAIFGVTSIIAGYLLSPLGISKIRATPTWCLYSIGASVLLFMLLHWICDVQGLSRWASFSRPAGQNTLLTYLLPDLYFFIVSAAGFTYFTRHLNAGLPGALRCAVFTLLILALSALLTRCKIRLQL